MLWAVPFCQRFRAQGRFSRFQCEGSRFTATEFSQSHLQQVSFQIRLSLPGDAHLAFSTPFGLDGARQWCEAAAWRMQHCKHPQCSFREGLSPQTIPQDGDGPQGPYKPAINPQIRDIKAGTAGKTGLINWYPNRATPIYFTAGSSWAEASYEASCATASLICLSTLSSCKSVLKKKLKYWYYHQEYRVYI